VTVLALAPIAPARCGIGWPPHVSVGVEFEDTQLLTRLRAGDEDAFRQLVGRYHGALKGFARTLGAGDAGAEEVVQEAWLVALESLDRFEERSSIKAWLFGIVKNKARRRAERDRRTVPFSAVPTSEEGEGPVVDPARFQSGDGCWPGHWNVAPRPWHDPERRLASLEARAQLREAIAELPERQRVVVALRDVEGLDPEEVCELLEISEGNQRVLLHRGRAAIRDRLEEHFDEQR
jgi:RNA polymerase sigma-70 factor, ECF subfamily